ncbi:uncharacterized protein L969DRAFT_23110 [Mixia osmundae IAM 14324]|uniref:Uncharacterized protein n=1 Tax=Mixia osmundae (strain CBS 9802 / IAM 14324 / JCM 22182 / KY 12970) TaxID=764103 RepID=G7E9B5_MIXOS|nr:uncharacterized protein L969DRAFT_23110 [Mixia osmundae IAM 14324]KEI39861.1 hypothetical protein L969DRAFT_23110 [Mixia osmundae IAM 14324]GAA99234.1 hypothetical protein E5Q_05928 [Mixia osmundae IAM 14324]
MSSPSISLRAGRCQRRAETRWVDPLPERGLLYIEQEDDLTHLRWRDLATNAIVDDLILFPGDASFSKVSQSSTGRIYVLKFSSSSARHFYWLQDPSDSEDAAQTKRLNDLIVNDEQDEQDTTMASNADAGPSYIPATPAPAQSAAPSAPAAPRKPESTRGTSQMDQMRSILANLGQSPLAQQDEEPAYHLTDVLQPSRLLPLLRDEKTREALFPYLPTDFEPTEETLQRVIQGPEFRRAVASLDAALRTGALAPLVASFGLPPDAAMGVDAFLKAIQDKADKERPESMQE